MLGDLRAVPPRTRPGPRAPTTRSGRR